ncbi:hypothetical protein C5L25_000912 [Secundilactobacillus silagei JCM 19001]|uniref:Uncharacterized protein n=1 Tax=Secundilactobacillus silagei JCM 19001 TaxID=1302250 RepID=A0A1Z5IKQ7_9LACO|nr:hypothetical protein C5L25_000912 [Secundilactobacillus silagei JCM 19001]GAX02355.1 hypothetical protein IWT126_02424 [Secundilactobacillus silagei JCM 19001]
MKLVSSVNLCAGFIFIYNEIWMRYPRYVQACFTRNVL